VNSTLGAEFMKIARYMLVENPEEIQDGINDEDDGNTRSGISRMANVMRASMKRQANTSPSEPS